MKLEEVVIGVLGEILGLDWNRVMTIDDVKGELGLALGLANGASDEAMLAAAGKMGDVLRANGAKLETLSARLDSLEKGTVDPGVEIRRQLNISEESWAKFNGPIGSVGGVKTLAGRVQRDPVEVSEEILRNLGITKAEVAKYNP